MAKRFKRQRDMGLFYQDFRLEQLTCLGLEEGLFVLFLGELERMGLVVNESNIVDASFVEV